MIEIYFLAEILLIMGIGIVSGKIITVLILYALKVFNICINRNLIKKLEYEYESEK